MSEQRDPRTDPKAGDVFRNKNGDMTRRVIEVHTDFINFIETKDFRYSVEPRYFRQWAKIAEVLNPK